MYTAFICGYHKGGDTTIIDRLRLKDRAVSIIHSPWIHAARKNNAQYSAFRPMVQWPVATHVHMNANYGDSVRLTDSCGEGELLSNVTRDMATPSVRHASRATAGSLTGDVD